ncbi:GNAT family N-acetyltransferase [Vibrio salinus]|uniref:GNAT family N-acetyltransferase n=1 Tax=Vibrio salinus TaxID=2899784 RepID=UPI001E30A0A5|nr:GNAT family N-acetyltransferase [Vibrio salinus]MCE0492459.1 GNAT family N-acetyltransferase [Vibrio salinus]
MVITTNRLCMTSISESDWMLFKQLHSDPRVINLCFDELDEFALKSKFESRLAAWTPDSDTWLCLIISDRNSGKKIGLTGFCMVDGGIAEVGYLLLPEFYGRNYATESLIGLIDWATMEHGITNYKAVVTEGNVASERVLIKCGFHLHDVIPESYEIAGKRYADRIYLRHCRG